MSKHTPGPWWFAGMEIGTVPNMDIKVARVSGANLEEAKANGRLMSKAPELLSALEQVNDCLVKCLTGGEVSAKLAGKAIENAALVMAEAKGEQP